MQEIFRETAITALSERLTAAITAANAEAAKETDRLFEEQAELGRRRQELDRGVGAVQVGIADSSQCFQLLCVVQSQSHVHSRT